MQIERFSITMDPDLGSLVRNAAKRSKTSVSAWLADAAAGRLRNELLGRAVDAWEAEDGRFTDEEIEAARKALGGGSRRRPRKS